MSLEKVTTGDSFFLNVDVFSLVRTSFDTVPTGDVPQLSLDLVPPARSAAGAAGEVRRTRWRSPADAG
ncbi:MAG TPA: hypothetical protein VIJ22_18875, partial [Polyangiaceae bacterium]